MLSCKTRLLDNFRFIPLRPLSGHPKAARLSHAEIHETPKHGTRLSHPRSRRAGRHRVRMARGSEIPRTARAARPYPAMRGPGAQADQGLRGSGAQGLRGWRTRDPRRARQGGPASPRGGARWDPRAWVGVGIAGSRSGGGSLPLPASNFFPVLFLPRITPQWFHSPHAWPSWPSPRPSAPGASGILQYRSSWAIRQIKTPKAGSPWGERTRVGVFPLRLTWGMMGLGKDP